MQWICLELHVRTISKELKGQIENESSVGGWLEQDESRTKINMTSGG